MVTAKPVTAPISIMPSMPRLSTPLFSTTNSPVAARRIGVVTPTTGMRASMKNPIFKSQPRQKHADRMEPAEERNDDRGKAVAGGEAQVDLPELARGLENARKPS